MKEIIIQQDTREEYVKLVSHISETWDKAKSQAITAVNAELLLANWETGQYIVEFEQKGIINNKILRYYSYLSTPNSSHVLVLTLLLLACVYQR